MKKSYKIGIVKYTDHASLNRIELGAKNCLKELGEKYGITFDYENYVYDCEADNELMKKAGKDLASAKVDLVISIATPPTVAMKDILAENKINMLFRAVSDPISANVIDSFEKPGLYITGTSDSLDGGRLAQVALAAVPNAKKVENPSLLETIHDNYRYNSENKNSWLNINNEMKEGNQFYLLSEGESKYEEK